MSTSSVKRNLKKHSASSVTSIPRPLPPAPTSVVHHLTRYITLYEDHFGTLFRPDGSACAIKRFTWSNHNKIQVQVITYGARITSLKLPNRAGFPEDVVLGFDDLAGYLHYNETYLGATIGRTSNRIEGSTYVAEGKQYWVTKNEDYKHHYNGGFQGFDKVIWTPYVTKNKLILSYIASDLEEKYPGELAVRISFELTPKCEFKINITANTTKTTPVDITNLTYFNLAGHEKGPEELGKHVVLINANCYTPTSEKTGFSTGKIMAVAHTRYDFQVPTLMQKAMGIGKPNGYNQNLCVNRGVDQTGDIFVARVTHPFSGRVLEIYSNQRGVKLATPEVFGNGLMDIPSIIMTDEDSISTDTSYLQDNQGVFILVKKLEEYMNHTLKMHRHDYEAAIRDLIDKLGKVSNDPDEMCDDISNNFEAVDYNFCFILKPLEWQLLYAIKNLLPNIADNPDDLDIQAVIDEMLIRSEFPEDNNSGVIDDAYDYVGQLIDKQIINNESKQSAKSVSSRRSRDSYRTSSCGSSCSKVVNKVPVNTVANSIPARYSDGRVHGKGDVIYKDYCAMCLQTQNYPDALYHSNFPNQLLRPDETYNHSITYKFWILAGDPTRWLQRMERETDPCYIREMNM